MNKTATYNKDTIKKILLEDCELSVDFGAQIGEDTPYRNDKGEAAIEMRYPAILIMRVFVDWVPPKLNKDKSRSLPVPPCQDNTLE